MVKDLAVYVYVRNLRIRTSRILSYQHVSARDLVEIFTSNAYKSGSIKKERIISYPSFSTITFTRRVSVRFVARFILI